MVLDSLETKANFLLFNQKFNIIGTNYPADNYGREQYLAYSDDLFDKHAEKLRGKVVAIDDISMLLFGGKSIPEILEFLAKLQILAQQLIIVSHWDTQDPQLDQLNALIGHESFVLQLQKLSSGFSEHVDGEFLVYDDEDYHEYLYKVSDKGGQLLHK